MRFEKDDLYELVQDCVANSQTVDKYIKNFGKVFMDKIVGEFASENINADIITDYIAEYKENVSYDIADEDLMDNSEVAIELLLNALPELEDIKDHYSSDINADEDDEWYY